MAQTYLQTIEIQGIEQSASDVVPTKQSRPPRKPSLRRARSKSGFEACDDLALSNRCKLL